MAEVRDSLAQAMGSSSFKKYLDEIKAFHPLESEREIKLGRIAQQGLREGASEAQKKASVAARQELVEHNLKLVVKVAKNYGSSGVPIEELTGAGNHGLMLAAERFNPRYRRRFSTFAFYWIRWAIQRAIGESHLIRRPQKYSTCMKRIHQCECFVEGRFEQDIDALHQGTGLSKRKIKCLLYVPSVFLSLNAPQIANPDLKLEDAIPGGLDTPLELLLREEKSQLVRKCVDGLNPIERWIVLARYGSASPKRKSLSALGEILGHNQEYIRQIEKNALGRLRARLGGLRS